jgi:hypothetical protein
MRNAAQVAGAVVGLSGESIAAGSKPTEFPDFTLGKWKTTKPKFALDESRITGGAHVR